MKKILLLSMVALTAACCGPKKNVTDVDKLIADPAQHAGKEITFAGKAVVTNQEAGRVAIYGADSTKYIIVQVVDTVKVCPSVCGKSVEIVGSIVEVEPDVLIIDSVCHAAFVVEKYYVVATSIKPAKGCCKKGEEKNCKKGEGKKCKKDEGESCAKDTAAAIAEVEVEAAAEAEAEATSTPASPATQE
jgi:hypothetical protein